jgi:hypothetical protein
LRKKLRLTIYWAQMQRKICALFASYLRANLRFTETVYGSEQVIEQISPVSYKHSNNQASK